MNHEEAISVQIMGNEYRVACPPDERDALQTAAQYLNDTMLGIRNTGKVLGIERIAVMAALNISYELLIMQKQAAALEGATGERVQGLLQKIDDAIRQLELNRL